VAVLPSLPLLLLGQGVDGCSDDKLDDPISKTEKNMTIIMLV
jgi:hypothetical protein